MLLGHRLSLHHVRSPFSTRQRSHLVFYTTISKDGTSWTCPVATARARGTWSKLYGALMPQIPLSHRLYFTHPLTSTCAPFISLSSLSLSHPHFLPYSQPPNRPFRFPFRFPLLLFPCRIRLRFILILMAFGDVPNDRVQREAASFVLSACMLLAGLLQVPVQRRTGSSKMIEMSELKEKNPNMHLEEQEEAEIKHIKTFEGRGEGAASWWSQMAFSWITELLVKGKEQQLSDADLFPLLEEDTTYNSGERLYVNWNKQVEIPPRSIDRRRGPRGFVSNHEKMWLSTGRTSALLSRVAVSGRLRRWSALHLSDFRSSCSDLWKEMERGGTMWREGDLINLT